MNQVKEKVLTDKQLKVIDMLIENEKSISDICSDVGIARSTFYDWRRGNKLFNQKLDEAVEERVKTLKQNVRSNAAKYVKWLEDIAEKSKNDNARVAALGKLSTLGELDPAFKQEITVKNDESEQKNVLLGMLKKNEEEQDSVH